MGLKERLEEHRKVSGEIYNVTDTDTGERFRVEDFGTWKGLIPEHSDKEHYCKQLEKLRRKNETNLHSRSV